MIDEILLEQYEKNYAPILKKTSNSFLFSMINNEKIDKNFNIDIKGFSYKQGKSGYCWLVSALQCISIYLRNTKNIELFFDCKYLMFFDKLEKSNYFLSSVIDNFDKSVTDNVNSYVLKNAMTDKGQWTMACNLIKKYGLVPMQEGDMIIDKSTSELNACLSYILRNYALKIRMEKKKNTTQESIINIKQKALQIIYNFLVDFYGKPNLKKFYFKSEDFTPKEFLNKYVQFPFDDYISIYASDLNEYIQYEVECDGNVWGESGNKFLGVSNSIFSDILENQIKQQGFCWCSGDAGKFYIKSKQLFDDSVVDLLSILDFEERDDINRVDIYRHHIAHMSHAMVFIGIQDTGKKKQYVIYDSAYEIDCGRECIMSFSWFNKYLFQGVVHKKYLPEGYMSKVVRKNIKPWSFFGI